MIHLIKKIIPCLIAICLIASCQDAATNNGTSPTSTEESIPSESKKKDCKIQGKILPNNKKLVKDVNTLFCITADSSTYDAKLGDSHRVLEIYDTRNCNLIKREVLPINRSPDFPYNIADIIFNKKSHLIAIKGFSQVYCYDIDNQKTLPALSPEFLNKRMAVDAQSGQIKHLEVWENYLIGHAQDAGTFVFDLTNSEKPKALKPAAEFDTSDGQGENFSSLFFLKSENEDTYQAILPVYDENEFSLNVNALFENPKFVSPFIPKNVRNNKFVIIRTQEKPSQTIAVDMSTQSKVEIPKEIAALKTQKILDWLKTK